MAGYKKIFTDEEIEILLQNPYVLKVTRHTINYTVEFKRYVYYELLKGRKTSEILRELGIDPRMLGIGRVNMLKMNLFKEAGSPKGLHDINCTLCQGHFGFYFLPFPHHFASSWPPFFGGTHSIATHFC